MKADLHNHTKYSDGALNVKDLAILKKKEGFSLIAITDHDSIDAYQEFSCNLALPVLLGVELSTYYKGENIHLLGYFKAGKPITREIKEFLTNLVEKRKTRVMKMISLLKDKNIDITYENVVKYADGAIARPHVAKAIQEKYPLSWEEIFDNYIGEDAPCYVQTENLELEDAILLLHRNHALAVLAHPHYIVKNKIEEILKLDLDGIEVYYPTMNEHERMKYLRLAKEHDLFVTGGSDFHEKRESSKKTYPYGLKGKALEIFLKEMDVDINDRK